MIGAVLNTLNRTQCFFYRSVAGLPRGLAVNLERWQTRTNRWSMIQSAQRIENYHYAIRHLAGAAEALTRAGREVIYLADEATLEIVFSRLERFLADYQMGGHAV